MPTLPRGHHRLSRDEVRADQRDRLLVSVVAVVAAKGYGGATIGDVLKRAHISRETFYQHFADKQECFLAAFDGAADLLIAMVEESLGPDTDPVLVRLDRVLATYLAALAGQRALARTFLIEVYGAGRATVSRRIAVQERFALAVGDAITRDQRWRGGLAPEFVGRAVIGAVSALVTRYVDTGDYERLPELREQILRFVGTLVDSH
jgi:AcrR family transcriptional regulator